MTGRLSCEDFLNMVKPYAIREYNEIWFETFASIAREKYEEYCDRVDDDYSEVANLLSTDTITEDIRASRN